MREETRQQPMYLDLVFELIGLLPSGHVGDGVVVVLLAILCFGRTPGSVGHAHRRRIAVHCGEGDEGDECSLR
jgi:hypothetical protein